MAWVYSKIIPSFKPQDDDSGVIDFNNNWCFQNLKCKRKDKDKENGKRISETVSYHSVYVERPKFVVTVE